jgi:hypothetical protein
VSEHALWESLRGLLPPDCHATRIESDVSPGFPDVHYSYKEVTGTIELKKSRKSPKSALPFSGKGQGLRKSQIDWIGAELYSGGLVWIIAQVGRTIYVLDGQHADNFNKMTVHDLMRCSVTVWQSGAYPPGLLDKVLRNDW